MLIFLRLYFGVGILLHCSNWSNAKKFFFSICCWFWKQPIKKSIINQYSILIVSFSRALNLKFTYNIWFVFAYRLNAKSATNEEKIFFSFDQFAPCNSFSRNILVWRVQCSMISIVKIFDTALKLNILAYGRLLASSIKWIIYLLALDSFLALPKLSKNCQKTSLITTNLKKRSGEMLFRKIFARYRYR